MGEVILTSDFVESFVDNWKRIHNLEELPAFFKGVISDIYGTLRIINSEGISEKNKEILKNGIMDRSREHIKMSEEEVVEVNNFLVCLFNEFIRGVGVTQ